MDCFGEGETGARARGGEAGGGGGAAKPLRMDCFGEGETGTRARGGEAGCGGGAAKPPQSAFHDKAVKRGGRAPDREA